MLALAQFAVVDGLSVSGSDLYETPTTQAARRAGVNVAIGHAPENLGDADLVVTTAAATPDNIEARAAKARGIRLVKRSQLLAQITNAGRSLAVAGTHGKTTTSAMAGYILRSTGAEPTIFTGGFVITPEGATGPCIPGSTSEFVVEADEYDRSFLHLNPSVSLITSLDFDHPDCYADMEDMVQAYGRFLGQTSSAAVLAARSEHLMKLAERLAVATELYGIEGDNLDWSTADRESTPVGTRFTLLRRTDPVGEFEVRLPGLHNVENAVGAVAAAVRFSGKSADVFAPALRGFLGTERRLQVKGAVDGVLVVDDYAHHPAEIRASLNALRRPGRRIRVIFQPHTYSRTASLVQEFASSLALADDVILLDIYAARETPQPGITSQALAAESERLNPSVRYLASREEAVDELARSARPGDVLVTMGAGDVTMLAGSLLARLQEALPVAG